MRRWKTVLVNVTIAGATLGAAGAASAMPAAAATGTQVVAVAHSAPQVSPDTWVHT